MGNECWGRAGINNAEGCGQGQESEIGEMPKQTVGVKGKNDKTENSRVRKVTKFEINL